MVYNVLSSVPRKFSLNYELNIYANGSVKSQQRILPRKHLLYRLWYKWMMILKLWASKHGIHHV
jgi:hypothetical protein